MFQAPYFGFVAFEHDSSVRALLSDGRSSVYAKVPFRTTAGAGIRDVRLHVERRKVTKHTSIKKKER